MKKALKTIMTLVLLLSITSIKVFAVGEITENAVINLEGTLNNYKPGVISVAYDPSIRLDYEYQKTTPIGGHKTLSFANNGTTPVNIYLKSITPNRTTGFWVPEQILRIDSKVKTTDWDTVEPNIVGVVLKPVPSDGVNQLLYDHPTYGEGMFTISAGKEGTAKLETYIPRSLSGENFDRFELKFDFIFESIY